MPAPQPILLPEEALPVDALEMRKALVVLSQTARGQYETHRQEFVLTATNLHTGKKRPVRFIDSTLTQILAALKRTYAEDDPQVFLSLCWRLSALAALIRTGVLESWVLPSGLGQTAVPDVVLEVAATLPLVGQPGFDPGSFLAALPALQD